MIEKSLVKTFGDTVNSNKAVKMSTYSVYTVKMPGYPFLPPFMAPDDDVALDCLKETASTVKEFVKSRLYKLGTFCLLDGKLVVFPNKRLVTLKETN